jgi:mannose-6-phosphate isomerase
MCVEGNAEIIYHDNQRESLQTGDTVLIPADLKEFIINAADKCKLIEIHMPDMDEKKL